MELGMEYGTESGHCWMGLSEYICSSNPSQGATTICLKYEDSRRVGLNSRARACLVNGKSA